MTLQQISASAGSGKTYTLTRLFLERLARAATTTVGNACFTPEIHASESTGYGLSEILAATFTNKAADEMKTRLIRSLKQRVLETRNRAPSGTGASHTAARFDQWLSSIFRHYSSLNIRTIDSLLNQLVRLSALQLGLPPHFSPGFSQEEYLGPAYDALAADLGACLRGDIGPNDPVFLVHNGETLVQSLNSAFKSLVLSNAIKGYSNVKPVKDSVYALVERLLSGKELVRVDEDRLYGLISAEYAHIHQVALALSQLLIKEQLEVSSHMRKALDQVLEMKVFGPLSTSTMLDKESLDECLNKKSKGTASYQAVQAHEEFRKGVFRFRKNFSLLKMALRHSPLVPLAEELHARILQALHETAILPAPCIPVLAQQLLSGDMGVSEALCRMGTRLTHLLLDEFQDTSILQWQAIMPLAEESLSRGGSLTYVGDVKQAIYGWRGGEVSLFSSVLREPTLRAMLASAPKQEALPFNWRSSKEIIWHNNAFFALLQRPEVAEAVMRAMLPDSTPEPYLDSASQQLVSMYTGSSQQLPERECENTASRGRVCLYSLSGRTNDELEATLARRLKPLFAELATRWEYGDMAVLVRTGEEGRFVASCLAGWKIPVVTANSFLLSGHPLVLRLISFLRFIDYPFNDLAFWEFVTSAECFGETSGLSARALENWLAAHNANKRQRQEKTPLYVAFRKAFPREWEALIAPFYAQAGLMSSYDLLMEIIDHYGLFARLPEQKPFLLRLLEIAHLAEKQGLSSLSAFLDFWDTRKAEEKLPLPEGMNAVRIMTTFMAKGLEFPVVILPFHHHGQQRDNELVITEVNGTPMLTSDSPFLPETYFPARITECLEHLNLVYVAWTRPVHELHAFITRPQRSTPLSRGMEVLLRQYREQAAAEHTASGLPLCTLEDLVPSEGMADEDMPDEAAPPENRVAESLHSSAGPAAPASAPCHDEERDSSPSQALPRLPDAGRIPMDWLPRLKIFRTAGDETLFSPRQRGNLAHLCLEFLTLRGPETREEDVERSLTLAFQHFPLPVPDEARQKEDLKRALLWFASLPDAPLWLRKAEKEQAVMDKAGHLHRVDALVELDDHLLVIEYKTGTMHEEDAVDRPPPFPAPNAAPDADSRAEPGENHYAQVRRYLRLLSEAQDKPVLGLLVYLDCRETREVRL